MTRVFLLTWEDLEQFLNSVTSILPKYSISAFCSDRLSRSFSTIDELRDFGNPERCAITELKIVGLNEREYEKFSVTLNHDERHNVRIYINTPEQTGVRLNEIANDFVDSLRPWYSWVSRTDWYLAVIGMWVLFWLGSLAIILVREDVITFNLPKDGLRTRELTKGFALGLLPMIVGVGLNSIRTRYFPMGAFAFGHGLNRHTRSEVIRTVVIAAFAVSVISSIVVAWFQ